MEALALIELNLGGILVSGRVEGDWGGARFQMIGSQCWVYDYIITQSSFVHHTKTKACYGDVQ